MSAEFVRRLNPAPEQPRAVQKSAVQKSVEPEKPTNLGQVRNSLTILPIPMLNSDAV